jgi:hypothetical protein
VGSGELARGVFASEGVETSIHEFVLPFTPAMARSYSSCACDVVTRMIAAHAGQQNGQYVWEFELAGGLSSGHDVFACAFACGASLGWD